MDQLDIIPRHECEAVPAASRNSFEKFCELHQLRPLPIRGAGVVFRRSEFVAAVNNAIGESEPKRGAA